MDRFSEELYGAGQKSDFDVVDVCDNCGQTACDRHRVYEYENARTPRFYACDECYDEIMSLIERAEEGADLYPAERQILATLRDIARKPVASAAADAKEEVA